MQTIPKPIPALTESDKTRFWEKVQVKGTDECWEWQSSLTEKGYGTFTLKGISVRAHRVSLFIKKGQFDDKMPHALHTCDNPKCCNPSHLFAGSHTENMRDMMEKNRGGQLEGVDHSSRTRIECRPRGECHKYSKFTEQQVLDIRRRIAERSASRKQLALDYGVSVSTITAIHLRQNWFHV